MIRFNAEKLNGRKIKLFIRPKQDKHLIEKVKDLYSDDCIEVFMVNQFGQPIDDRAEYFCYKDQWIQDLPVLLICPTKNEWHILERYKNFDI